MLGFQVAYHGQHFTGWHRQRSGDGSVQATLERAVSDCLRNAGAPMDDVRLNALTDVASAKGAHSRGQLCFFRATPEAMALVQGTTLELTPPGHASIVAAPLRPLGDSWPRPSRVHAAYFFQQGQPVRELAPFAWYVRDVLQSLALQRAVAALEGTHDFSMLSRDRSDRVRKTTIKHARVTVLPATIEAFDLQQTPSGSRQDANGVVSQGAGSSWLLRLEILTADGCGNLPSQLMQRLAALLRRVATPSKHGAGTSTIEPEDLAKAAESTVRAVLGGNSSEAEALAVAPARGLWLEQVPLQRNDGCATPCRSNTQGVCRSSAAAEPAAKRAATRVGSAAEDTTHEHSVEEVQVHTISARVLLSPTTGACWVGPTKPGSQRLRVSDYDRLLQLHPEPTASDRSHVVVGVNSAALPLFFSKVWPRVHANVRCVILSADSDWGVPGEVWCKNKQQRVQGKTLEGTAVVLPTLQNVLEDPRLVAWFTQNYDFGFGCHLEIARSCCSDPSVLVDDSVSRTPESINNCNSLSLLTVAPLHKLRPLPIGVDFHSLSQKAVSGVVYRGMRASSAEHQQAELDLVAASLPPFATRPLIAYGSRWRALSKSAAAASPFAMSREASTNLHATTSQAEISSQDGGGEGCCPRALALNVFSDEPFSRHVTIEKEELNRSELWRRHGNYAFVISPPGHGLDCHRTWEALALGCIPITLAPGPYKSAAATTKIDNGHAVETGETRQTNCADKHAASLKPDNVELLGGADKDHSGAHVSPWRNPLFSGLPVVVVQRWEDVTERALHIWRDQWATSFDPATPQGRALADALRLEHWCRALQ